MEKTNEQRILDAHAAITRTKGNDYSPTVEEIQEWIDKQIFEEKVSEARETWGSSVVNEVLTMVQVSDPDGLWSMYEDLGRFNYAECVEFLYFEC